MNNDSDSVVGSCYQRRVPQQHGHVLRGHGTAGGQAYGANERHCQLDGEDHDQHATEVARQLCAHGGIEQHEALLSHLAW
jgi:hypothetical protein